MMIVYNLYVVSWMWLQAHLKPVSVYICWIWLAGVSTEISCIAARWDHYDRL